MKRVDKFFNKLRSEKTELLSSELKKHEQRIESIKNGCYKTAKKIEECSRCPHKEGMDDTRMKKLPEYILAQKMKECGDELQKCDEGSLLGKILLSVGDIEEKIAHQIITFETTVDERVLNSLSKVYKSDYQNVVKYKQALTKVTSDRDAAKSKYQQAARSSTYALNGKMDNCQGEYEDLKAKVDSARDQLEFEMLSFLRKEPEISECVLDYLRKQQEYFKRSYDILEMHIHEVEQEMKRIPHEPIFSNTRLEQHLASYNRTVALPLEMCICGLIKSGLDEEGLFRIAGSASKVKKLKVAFDVGSATIGYLKDEDPHVLANVLKSYLRELPEPLLTFDLHDEWKRVIQISNQSEKLHEMRTVLQKMPETHYANLKYLIRFLGELTKYQDSNKMTPANIAIVLGPNILWARDQQDGNPMGNMTIYALLVEHFVTFVDDLFPDNGDFAFFVTYLEEEWGDSSSHSLISHPVSDHDDSSLAKRSQSSSSLEDPHNISPHGSPKIVLRRKNKPAPIPPGSSKPPNAPQVSTAFTSSNSSPNMSKDADNHRRVRYDRIQADNHVPPPSPSQLTAKKSVEQPLLGNDEQQNAPKSIPPKPPQPNFMHTFGTKDAEPRSNVPDKFYVQSSSNLRHQSSFNSGSRASGKDDSTVHSSTSKSNSTSGTLNTYSSLPRQYQTENSYKRRSPRPGGSGMPPPPAVPTASGPPQPIGFENFGTRTSVPAVERRDGKTGSDAVSQTQSIDLGTVEVPDTRQTLPNEHDLETAVVVRRSKDDVEEVEVVVAPPSVTAVPENSRPIPAPRSSLISNSTQVVVGKEKDSSAPVVKERPVVMAKPRDLGKRWGSIPAPADSNPSYEHIAEIKSPHSQPSTKPIDLDPLPMSDHEETVNNGYAEDASVTPKSPRTPYKPPRPQPPLPAKSKAESTDL